MALMHVVLCAVHPAYFAITVCVCMFFRNFLVNSTDYEDTVALKLLSEAGIEDILFEYSMVKFDQIIV